MRVTRHEANVSVTRSSGTRMWLWLWPRTGLASYGSVMVKKARTHNANAERKLSNMADGVILTHALAGIAEVKAWKLETLSAAGDDVDERERVEASVELTKSPCRYGKQVERMLKSGISLEEIAHLTDVAVDELRLAVSYVP